MVGIRLKFIANKRLVAFKQTVNHRQFFRIMCLKGLLSETLLYGFGNQHDNFTINHHNSM